MNGVSDPVFLIGYMASGKTTLGRALSEATGRGFVDLDEYIEQKTGKTVSEIFAQDGEAEFRRLETASLGELAADSRGLIIACGGGTPCFGDNMERMNSVGLTVWLDTSTDVILRRLLAERSSRPLVASLSEGGELEDYVAVNLERRRPYYSRAASRFDSTFLETEAEVASSVSQFIEKYFQY